MKTLACLSLLSIAFGCFVAVAAESEEFQFEEGFKPLFNGKDLSGWMVRGGESLEGKTEAPKGRFQVREGRLVIDGGVKGNLVIDSEQEFAGDVVIRFEYKPGEKCNNDLYLRGVKFDIKPGSVKNLADGEWNRLEISITGGTITISNNGEVQHTSKVKGESSPLGIRAEFGDIEYRRLRYR